MREIRFFIPGIPRPGGSKKVFGIKKGGIYTGRFVVTDAAGKGNRDWRASVGESAARSIGDEAKLLGPIELELVFRMPRPKSHFKKDGVTPSSGFELLHTKMPDVGKLARSTTDACKGILWRDDSQIVKETHEKWYSDQPGCHLIAKEIEI